MKNQKSLGQNWLKNRAILDQIAALAATSGVANCLEIGPGLGTLTSSLLKQFPHVVAVEFDSALAANLPQSFPGKNLTVISADILALDFATAIQPPFVVAGNIPYYITSPIIRKLLTLGLAAPANSAQPSVSRSLAPVKIVLLIQKEVAERIAAELGAQTLLSLFVQNLAAVQLGPVVPRHEFTPPPQVDSQVIILTPRAAPQVPLSVLDFAKLGFSSPRKKLAANLAAATHQSKDFWRAQLAQQGIDPDARPANLSLQDWQNLSSVLQS